MDCEGNLLFSKEDKEESEEFHCESCDRRISKEEYYEYGGLCRYCRGAPTQRGFPSPPGFPKP
ncbi:MAG: hypothetical protein FJZ16_02630 [Candidatus Omnitrophica bacterium]|nr:hypothetical protein [Candidatus Omnitrophota bacterium]